MNLPPFVFPVFGQCLGFPNPEVQPVVKPRLPQQAILHRETYKLAEQEDALTRSGLSPDIARYNDIMKEF